MPKKTEEDKTLTLIGQALTIRQELTDRVVAMIIELSPEIAEDETIKRCISSLRIIRVALQKVAEEEVAKAKIKGEKDD